MATPNISDDLNAIRKNLSYLPGEVEFLHLEIHTNGMWRLVAKGKTFSATITFDGPETFDRMVAGEFVSWNVLVDDAGVR